MTREEAILLLHDMKDTYDEIHENTNYEIGYEQMTALDMAIEALQTGVVRCKNCLHANECHKSVQYTRHELNTVTIGYSPIEWCSRGERKGGENK